MRQLETVQLIKEEQLDQRNYFQSLFVEACRLNLLSEDEIKRIQRELLELMSKEVVRYTNDESSSIPIEHAKEIFQSITYSIGFYLKRTTDIRQKLDLLKSHSIESMFYQGMDAVSTCRNHTQRQLQSLKQKLQNLENIAYQDTINSGIPPFFQEYNIEFGAHEVPGSIDYPLFEPITELVGVEYMSEYLLRFYIEQDFLCKFKEENINRLLRWFHKDAEHMLINIFELVLTNYLGCSLLGNKEEELIIRQEELSFLQKSLNQLTTVEISEKLKALFLEKQSKLILEQSSLNYCLEAIPKLAAGIKHNLVLGKPDTLWVVAKEEEEAEVFEDRAPMEDEALRDLIDRLRDMNTTSGKVAVIKATVQSQADLIELLDSCFYNDEYEEVFSSFDETTKEILRKGILNVEGQRYEEEFEPQKEWQKLLFRKNS